MTQERRTKLVLLLTLAVYRVLDAIIRFTKWRFLTREA